MSINGPLSDSILFNVLLIVVIVFQVGFIKKIKNFLG
jgi:hypothetical protein